MLNPLFLSASSELTESQLLREVVYVFQGIEGKYVKYDVAKDAFRIDPNVSPLP